MYKLRRFYLDSIGVPDNRFSDLMVDLTGADGEPTDAIVWLRNGAGKTTMLSLLLALVLPDRRDFLATKTKHRILEDLILGTDTGHVVAEWVDPAGQVLLTGAVYEWDGRVRPRDYAGAGKDRLRRSWWCLSPDPRVEGATLDDLPFTTRTSGGVDRDRFRAHVRALAAQGVNATVADNTIAEWHAALRERRFDPELFTYFAEVNSVEGGIDALFSGIDSPGDFVKWLLRFVADRSRVSPVRDLLVDTSLEIAKRPAYLAERDFCAEAQPRLASLSEAHRRVERAGAQRSAVADIAAGYKRALLDAAEAADAEEAVAKERHEAFDLAAREASRSADQARRWRDEYYRLAAQFRLDQAQHALESATETARVARLEEDAWTAVGIKQAMAVAEAILDERRQALDVATTEARPLRDLLEQATARLAGALDAAIAGADERLTVLEDQLRSAATDHDAAEAERRQAVRDQSELESRRRELESAVAHFDAARARLAADGVVPGTENLDRALRRLVAETEAAAAETDQLEQQQRTLVGERRAAQHALEQVRRSASTAEADAQRHTSALQVIDERARRIADSARLRVLLQSDNVDLLVDAADALRALSEARTQADAEILDVRAAMAEDERAVHGLDAEQLLPPRPAVATVLAALAEAGLSAHPGWRYLAEHVPLEQHAAVITAMPDACDGVVVYGDPADAAARLDGLEVTDAVVLVSATEFSAGRSDTRVVLGPAAARHDRDAASTELEHRRTSLEVQRARASRLTDQREGDAALVAQITSLGEDLPADGIAGLRRRAEAAVAAAKEAAEMERAAATELDTLDAHREELEDLLGVARTRRTTTLANRRRVEELAATEADEVNPARAELGALPGRLRVATEAEEAANAHLETIEQERVEARNQQFTIQSTRRDWATERSILDEAVATDVSLDAARTAAAEAERQLRAQFPEAELRRSVEDAEDDVRRLAAPWVDTAPATQARTLELLADPRSDDAQLRADAVAGGKLARATAERAVGAAEAELREAQADLARETQKERRPDVPTSPTDRAQSLRLAEDQNEQAIRAQQEAGQRERDREAAQGDMARAHARAGMLRDQVESLRGVDVAETAMGSVPDSDDEVRAEVRALANDFDQAEREHATAMAVRSQRADQLRTWASSERFKAVADDENGHAIRRLRELFSGEGLSERIAARAADLADELGTREQAITGQLAEVETHKRNVVTRLVGLVDEALSVLSRASSLSELPAEVGPWGGQRFLQVEAKQRPTRDQIAVRVGELVDRMVSAGKVDLDANDLLWQATEAAVTEGFKATVLKPAPDQPTNRVPVEFMRKWSGGENLTASLVLFCVLAKLRAEQRTGVRSGAAGGVVPLDNPVGKANYLPFLDLQRKVANANGAQLVFWTGIGDLGAVTAFPRIAAMHKRPSATRAGSAYVRVDPDASHTEIVDVTSAVRRDP